MGLFSLPAFSIFTGDCQNARHPEEAKVKVGGLTTLLWIKPVFGVCGELW
jgi:hypothetical protein